jgi:hypothetical protein
MKRRLRRVRCRAVRTEEAFLVSESWLPERRGEKYYLEVKLVKKLT